MSRNTAKLVAGASATVDDFPVALAWSADGRQLAVGGGEGRLYLVDAASGAVRLLGEHAPGVLALAWQPKGTMLASAGQDGAVCLRDLRDEEPAPRILHRAARWAAGLGWRADGQQLAFAQVKEVHILDAAGQLVKVLTGPVAVLSQRAWSGRDELIAAGNGALFVDRIDTGAIERFVLEGTPQTLALSPDNRIAANGLADGTLNFRYLNNRKRSSMSGYAGKVDCTSWSGNSRYLATASTGASSVVVWDFSGKGPEGSEPLQLNAHEERIETLQFQPGGQLLASAGRDWRVALWRPGPGSRAALDIQLLDGPAGSAGWSPDGRCLAVTQPAGRVRFFPVSPS
jgi:WD40 repeat protein